MGLTFIEPLLHARHRTRHFTCNIYSILNANHASSILHKFSYLILTAGLCYSVLGIVQYGGHTHNRLII